MNLLSKECEIDALKNVHEYLLYQIGYEEIDGYTNNYILLMEYINILNQINKVNEKKLVSGNLAYPCEETMEDLLEYKLKCKEKIKEVEYQMGCENDYIQSIASGCIGNLCLKNVREYELLKPYASLLENILIEEARFLEDVRGKTVYITDSFYKDAQEESIAFSKEQVYLYIKEQLLYIKETILGELLKRNRIIDLFGYRRGEEYKHLFQIVCIISDGIEELSCYDRKSDQKRTLQTLLKEKNSIKLLKVGNLKIRNKILGLMENVEKYVEDDPLSIPSYTSIESPFLQKTYTKRKNMVY